MRITQRLELIKLVTLLGLLVSILTSINLWSGQRWFPKAPLFDNWSNIQPPYDYINIGVLVILILMAFFIPRKYPIIFLLMFCVYLCLDDQNRLQPWFYNYVLILFVVLFYKYRVDEPNNYTTVFISLQLLVVLVYIFSGIQKFNSSFLNDSYNWMISPLAKVFSERQMNLFFKLGHAVPYLEITIGLGLLYRPMRFIAIPLVIVMHVFILLMLGPLGKSYNYVVWPWNITMILLNLLLFANVPQERFFDVSILFKGITFYIVITLMLIFPIFSLNNKYDSYLSSSLYSANTHNCKLILSDNAYKSLPFYIRHYVTQKENNNILHIKLWALNELNAPCVPEYRVFERVQEHVIFLTHTNSQEVKMDFSEREKLLNF
jgi:hypothetical protein